MNRLKADGSNEHPIQSDGSSLTDRKVYPCSDCSMTFMDKAEATKHFISEHNKPKPEQKRTPKIAKRYDRIPDRRSFENYIPNITNVNAVKKRKTEVMHRKNTAPNPEKKMISILKPRFCRFIRRGQRKHFVFKQIQSKCFIRKSNKNCKKTKICLRRMENDSTDIFSSESSTTADFAKNKPKTGCFGFPSAFCCSIIDGPYCISMLRLLHDFYGQS